MKKGIILILLFIFKFYTAQDNIAFENTSFKEILAKAKAQKKLIFLDAYATWCGPCKLMERNTFTKKNVADYYNTNFINAHFDMEKGEGKELALKYKINSYPTLMFINSNGEVVYKGLGYLEPEEFISLGKQANNPSNIENSPKQRFLNGDSNPELLMDLIKTNINTDKEFTQKVAERYFETKKTKEFTNDEVYILLNTIPSSNSLNYKVFLNNKTEITKIITEDQYNEFQKQIKLNDIAAMSIDQKNNNINETYFLTEASKVVTKEEAGQMLIQFKVNYFKSIGNFVEYEKAAIEYYKNPDQFQPQQLLEPIMFFAENSTDPKAIQTATVWAEKSVMKGENPYNTYALAKLYSKNGKIEEAKMFATTSKKLFEEKKLDTNLIDNLIASFNTNK